MKLFRRSSRTLSLADSRGATTSQDSRSGPPTLDKHLLDYVRIVVKRRWTAISGLAAALVLAGLYLYVTVPIFEATVQILIEHENPNSFSLQTSAAQDQDRETTDYYHTQYTILMSRSLAKRAIDRMGAWNHGELTGRTSPADLRPTGIVGTVSGLATGLLAKLRHKASPPAADKTPAGPATSSLETPAQSASINAFLSRVDVVPVKTSRLVDIHMLGGDPKFAADAANALANAYIDQNLEVRLTAAKATSDYLTDQLAEQQHRIDVSENALQRFRESHDAVSLADRQNIITQKLTDLNGMVTRAKGDRIAREALYNQVRAIQKREAPLDTLPSILSNSYLQQLKADLSRLQAQYATQSKEMQDGYPEMVRLKAQIADADAKLQGELAKQVDAMRNEYEAAQTLETNLTAALDAQKREVVQLNKVGIDFASLERDVQTNRQIFDSLLQRTREKGIAGELRASDVRVIDAAQVPQVPVRPNRTETLLYASFFGTFFGLCLAFFFEYMDDHIKTPDEIKTYLGLPFLGMVPLITKKDSKDPIFAEALRQVRTNVIFAAEGRAHSLLVTSTGPGEGKTVVSSNLAKGLAQTGRKVVLIDVDMRRPRVHEFFGLAQQPGLSDLLTGGSSLPDVLRATSVSGLWVIPAGSPTSTPAELLSSPQFAQLVSSLPQQFEWLIIDSPPVAAVADACIVANRASAVLFVIGAQLVSRSAALNALEQLDAANATFVGGVLNRVKLRRDAYYYSSYYRPSYEQYYSKSTPSTSSGEDHSAAANG